MTIPTLKDIEDSKDAMDDIQVFTYSGADNFVDAKGVTRDTVAGRIKKMGYAVPIPYAISIVFAANDNVKTVEEAGIVYAPLPSSLPFTTSGTFIGDDDSRFFTIQGLTEQSADPRYSTVYSTITDMKNNTPVSGNGVVFSFGQILSVRDVANAKQQYKVVTTDTGIDLSGGFFAQIILDSPSEILAVLGNMRVGYIGHRGVPRISPENTIPAYFYAGRLKMWGAECDLQYLPLSDEWVLMHDDTVDRTTDGTGLVSSFTLAQIKLLDAGVGFDSYYTGTRVPTLTEYLNVCREYNMVPFIEIKETGVYTDPQIQQIIDLALFKFPDRQFVIATFSLSILRQLRNLDTTITLQYYTTNYSQSRVNQANEIGRCILAPAVAALIGATDSDIAYANQRGVLLNAWTVNDPDDATAMRVKGVRMITTDFINLP